MTAPMKMSNPLDPTPEDLRRWAYAPDAEYPDEMPEDWDLCVADIDRVDMLVELASDAECPNRGFFLGCLYILSGDCVRLERCRHHIPRLKQFMDALPPESPKEVQRWVRRTRHLIAHPESFEYGKWGRGDFAQTDGEA